MDKNAYAAELRQQINLLICESTLAVNKAHDVATEAQRLQATWLRNLTEEEFKAFKFLWDSHPTTGYSMNIFAMSMIENEVSAYDYVPE